MKIPEPGEHSHGKSTMKERSHEAHLREGVKHLEHHHKEERREVERKHERGMEKGHK